MCVRRVLHTDTNFHIHTHIHTHTHIYITVYIYIYVYVYVYVYVLLHDYRAGSIGRESERVSRGFDQSFLEGGKIGRWKS